MSRPLSGKTAVITGAASGIGAAISQALAADGVLVLLLDRAEVEKTGIVVRSIRQTGGAAEAHRLDVSAEDQILRFFASVGEIDILVNNAGILIEKPLLDTTTDDFDRLMDINLRGAFLMGREAIRLMSKRGSGRVINIASELAYLGRANASVYCASKGAILSMTRSWAREFAPHILINAIAPGPTDTPMLSPENTSPETLAEEIKIPLGRLGRPEEIAAAAVFLAGPGATFITGQCISPNGGAVMF